MQNVLMKAGKMDSIDDLLNKKLIKLGRASNLFWMIFSISSKSKNELERINEGAEYSIHCQSPWRIVDCIEHTIKLASADMYQPYSKIKWSEDFDWEPKGNNLFDEKISSFNQKDIEIRVIDVAMSENYDLKLCFSNGFIFECFVDISIEQECWRFFKKGNKKHLVISGTGKLYQ